MIVRDSLIKDIYSLSEHLRDEDLKEVLALGMSAKTALRASYKASKGYRKTAEIGGIPAAMWGVSGNLLSGVGYTYLLTSPASETISKFAFVRLYQNEVYNMSTLFPTLRGLVDKEYTKAVRLLRITGFTLTDFNERFMTYERTT